MEFLRESGWMDAGGVDEGCGTDKVMEVSKEVMIRGGRSGEVSEGEFW